MHPHHKSKQENMSMKGIPFIPHFYDVRERYTLHTPLFYSKPGVYRDTHIFVILIQNVDCGYLLVTCKVYPQSMF